MFMIPAWALDEDEVPVSATQNTVITRKTNGDKREWWEENGTVRCKLIEQEIINTSSCACSLRESWTCTAPCGYPAQQKKKEKEKLRELLQDMKCVHAGGYGADLSADYKDGWFNAISLIEDRMLEEKT